MSEMGEDGGGVAVKIEEEMWALCTTCRRCWYALRRVSLRSLGWLAGLALCAALPQDGIERVEMENPRLKAQALPSATFPSAPVQPKLSHILKFCANHHPPCLHLLTTPPRCHWYGERYGERERCQAEACRRCQWHTTDQETGSPARRKVCTGERSKPVWCHTRANRDWKLRKDVAWHIGHHSSSTTQVFITVCIVRVLMLMD